jgi:hypothetical protein
MNTKPSRPAHLLEVLDKHKATLSLPLGDGVGSEYFEYHALIFFRDGKITVNIYNDEGQEWDLADDGLDVRWIEQISHFVDQLKQSGVIPDYTLSLLNNE